MLLQAARNVSPEIRQVPAAPDPAMARLGHHPTLVRPGPLHRRSLGSPDDGIGGMIVRQSRFHTPGKSQSDGLAYCPNSP